MNDRRSTDLRALVEESDDPLEAADSPFDTPAQARAFGVVVALHREGLFEWEAFQERLIERIENAETAPDDPEAAYYEHWLAAAEAVLVEADVLEPRSLRRRAREFAAGDRTAEEFVEGRRDH